MSSYGMSSVKKATRQPCHSRVASSTAPVTISPLGFPSKSNSHDGSSMSVVGDASRAENVAVGSSFTSLPYQIKPAPKAARAPPANAPIVTHTGAPGPHAKPASAPAAMLPLIPAAVVVSSRLTAVDLLEALSMLYVDSANDSTMTLAPKLSCRWRLRGADCLTWPLFPARRSGGLWSQAPSASLRWQQLLQAI